MAGVNAYGANSNSNAIWGTDKNGNAVVKSDSDLNMDDFLNMLTAQMSNQDPMNPSTDMEFIGQMAQFTSLQAMKTLTELSMAQHGSSLIGKHVIVAHVDERGKLVNEKGQVTNVKFMGGMVTITVNGEEYEMSSVMEIITEEEANKPDKDDDKEDGKEDDTTPPKAEQRSGGTEVLSASASAASRVDNSNATSYTEVASAVASNAVSATTPRDTTTNVVHSREERALSDIRATQLAINDPQLYSEIKPYLEGGYVLAAPVSMDYNVLKANQTIATEVQAAQASTEVKSDNKVQTPVGEVNVKSAIAVPATSSTISQQESDQRAIRLSIENPELYAQLKPYLDQGYRISLPIDLDYDKLVAEKQG